MNLKENREKGEKKQQEWYSFYVFSKVIYLNLEWDFQVKQWVLKYELCQTECDSSQYFKKRIITEFEEWCHDKKI